MLALAFLGAWVVPIIMAACAVTIGISIAVIVGSWGSYAKGITNAIKTGTESAENGGEFDGNALANAMLDSTMIIAFTTLSIAVSILFLCLKAYTSLGSWVMEGAMDLAKDLILSAFLVGGAMEFSTGYEGEKPTTDIIMRMLDEYHDTPEVLLYILAGIAITVSSILVLAYSNPLWGLILSLIGLELILIGETFENFWIQASCLYIGFALSGIAILLALQGICYSDSLGEELLHTVTIIMGLSGACLATYDLVTLIVPQLPEWE